MLLTLVSVFLICWLPIQVFNLIIWCFQDLRSPQSSTHYYLYFGLYFSFHLLSQFHTFLNPFIYCYMSNNFNVSLNLFLLNSRIFSQIIHRKCTFFQYWMIYLTILYSNIFHAKDLFILKFKKIQNIFLSMGLKINNKFKCKLVLDYFKAN